MGNLCNSSADVIPEFESENNEVPNRSRDSKGSHGSLNSSGSSSRRRRRKMKMLEKDNNFEDSSSDEDSDEEEQSLPMPSSLSNRNEVRYIVGMDLGSGNKGVGVYFMNKVKVISGTFSNMNASGINLSFFKKKEKMMMRKKQNLSDLLRQSQQSQKKTLTLNVNDAPKEVDLESKKAVLNPLVLLGRKMQEKSIIQMARTVYPKEIIETEMLNNELIVKVINHRGVQRIYSPIDILSKIVKSMKKDSEQFLRKRVRNAVVVLPCALYYQERMLLEKTFRQMKLNISRMITASTSSAMYYGHKYFKDSTSSRNVLAIHHSICSTNVSFLKIQFDIFEVQCEKGDPNLSNKVFIKALERDIIQKLVDGYGLVMRGKRKMKSHLNSQSNTLNDKKMLLIRNEIHRIIEKYIDWSKKYSKRKEREALLREDDEEDEEDEEEEWECEFNLSGIISKSELSIPNSPYSDITEVLNTPKKDNGFEERTKVQNLTSPSTPSKRAIPKFIIKENMLEESWRSLLNQVLEIVSNVLRTVSNRSTESSNSPSTSSIVGSRVKSGWKKESIDRVLFIGELCKCKIFKKGIIEALKGSKGNKKDISKSNVIREDPNVENGERSLSMLGKGFEMMEKRRETKGDFSVKTTNMEIVDMESSSIAYGASLVGAMIQGALKLVVEHVVPFNIALENKKGKNVIIVDVNSHFPVKKEIIIRRNRGEPGISLRIFEVNEQNECVYKNGDLGRFNIVGFDDKKTSFMKIIFEMDSSLKRFDVSAYSLMGRENSSKRITVEESNNCLYPYPIINDVSSEKKAWLKRISK